MGRGLTSAWNGLVERLERRGQEEEEREEIVKTFREWKEKCQFVGITRDPNRIGNGKRRGDWGKEK